MDGTTWGHEREWSQCDRQRLLKLLKQFFHGAMSTTAAISTAAVAFSLVWVSAKLFSKVLLLLVSGTILKAINIKTRLTWKLEYCKENHDIVVLIIFR